MLLARIDFRLAGANWQRSGGKGKKPEMVKVPGSGESSAPKESAKQSGAEIAQKLRNLGLIPPAG